LARLSERAQIELPRTADTNWLGAIAAACFGVAQAFKIAVKMPASSFPRDGVFDLFRLDWSRDQRQASWPADRNVGKLLMVGAGSVGSSAGYCMRMSRLAGTITIVDKDPVKIENFNRSPVFGQGTMGMTKAEAMAGF